MDKILSYVWTPLGAILGASLLLNVFLFYNGQRQAEKKVECVSAVKSVNRAAEKAKAVIETRQDKVTINAQESLSSRASAITRGVLNRKSRVSDLPRPTDTPAVPDGASTSPVLLPGTVPIPDGIILLPEDEIACDIAVLKAVGWQGWYANQLEIRKEENVNPDTKGSGLPSP